VRPTLGAVAFASLLAVLATSDAAAVRVQDLAAVHKDGQTFLTWTSPAGTGWRYHIYVSDTPILYGFDLWGRTPIGQVRDSTWCDKRLSVILGQTTAFRIDAESAELAASQAVAVITPDSPGERYYCVTVSGNGLQEDPYVSGNTLLEPVNESVALPKPVYQRTVTVDGTPVEVWTLWPSHVDRPHYPMMANRLGFAYDLGIVRGEPGAALIVRPHHREGNFLQASAGTGRPGEWRLLLDDPLHTQEVNSFWFGYHENYDLHQYYHFTPTSGVVRNYTLQRILYTLDWARRDLPIDVTRVYAYGFSMGGIGSVMLAMHAPDRIAAVMSYVGKFDFSLIDDPDPTSAFNEGHSLREVANRLWGEVPTGLPSCDGPGVFQLLNFGYMAQALRDDGLPPIFAFNGKNDNVVGWAEKPPFYRAMEEARHGATFFWDQRSHVSGGANWSGMYDPSYLYRFRTNLSFPAISNCSANHDPGFGVPASGDSVGTINGFVEWDPEIVDTPEAWEVTLRLRTLQGTFTSMTPPERLSAWVTPRRLQQFEIEPLGLYQRTITRLSDGEVVDQTIEQADSTGMLTMTWVPIERTGTRLRVERVVNTTDVAPAPAVLRLELDHNPMRGRGAVSVTWARAGVGELELLDAAGRRVRTLAQGDVAAGLQRYALDGAGLSSGIYFLRARAGGLEASRRVVLLQ
jgi:hypothetical protein